MKKLKCSNLLVSDSCSLVTCTRNPGSHTFRVLSYPTWTAIATQQVSCEQVFNVFTTDINLRTKVQKFDFRATNHCKHDRTSSEYQSFVWTSHSLSALLFSPFSSRVCPQFLVLGNINWWSQCCSFYDLCE